MRIAPDRDVSCGEVKALTAFRLHFEMMQRRAFSQGNLGHEIPEAGGAAQRAMIFDQGCLAAFLQNNQIARMVGEQFFVGAGEVHDLDRQRQNGARFQAQDESVGRPGPC